MSCFLAPCLGKPGSSGKVVRCFVKVPGHRLVSSTFSTARHGSALLLETGYNVRRILYSPSFIVCYTSVKVECPEAGDQTV